MSNENVTVKLTLDNEKFLEGLNAAELTQKLLDLDLEYRLTIAMYVAISERTLAEYLVRRREVLLPEIYRKAEAEGRDPIEVFIDFRRNLVEHFEKKGLA